MEPVARGLAFEFNEFKHPFVCAWSTQSDAASLIAFSRDVELDRESALLQLPVESFRPVL